MDIIEALNKRYTCRAFKSDPVSAENITRIIDIARRTPSWGNTQPWHIYAAAGEVLEGIRKGFLANFALGAQGRTDLPLPQEWPDYLKHNYVTLGRARQEILCREFPRETITQVVQERNYRFFDAPAVIYLCMDRSLTSYSMFDLGAMSQSIMLAAQEYGLDTAPAVMLVHFPDLIREALLIPEDHAMVLGIAIGYADTLNIHNQFRSERRPLEDVAAFFGFE